DLAKSKALQDALVSEKDALASEKDAASQSANDLQQKLTAQAEVLQQAHNARDQHAALIKSLQDDLAKSKALQDALVSEKDALASEKDAASQSANDLQQKLTAQAEALHRLRHLARPLAASRP
ncbi:MULTISPECIES: DUF4407 domain-containing protein, partial [unclassified Cyanobium]|uniref:DUF4407 domain-containing protein n=1 Tax=unclassified Cyanobium TaxID=2627006 RepID=UPI0020CE0DDE